MENKLVLFGKEYKLELANGLKDVNTGILIVDLIIAENEDKAGTSQAIRVQIRPSDETYAEYEKVFSETIRADYAKRLEEIKQKEVAAKAAAQ
jgi:hypothetical protein